MNIDSFSALRLPREILFGENQVAALGKMSSRLGNRALVCTDTRFSGTSAFKDICRHLEEASIKIEVFDRVEPDVPCENVYQGVESARAFAPDVVIGLGGGSCIDLAKCASLLLTHGGKLEDYYGEFKVPGPVIPTIAVPTTSGTGSEVTPVAVVSDSGRELKVGISSPYIVPKGAICDPLLTWSCPPLLTAIAGVDALTHAIEAFTAVQRQPDSDLAQNHVFVGKNAFSDMFALKAIKLLGQSLEAAYRDGNTRKARSDMMLGALSAGCAFAAAGTSLAHAIQYPIGAITKTAHGLGVATMLPFVMNYNRGYAMEAMCDIALALGLKQDTQTPDQFSKLAITETRRLLSAVAIPTSLRELGLPEDRLTWVADQSMGIGRLIKNNPRQIDGEEMKHLLRAAYHGDLPASAQI